MRPLTAQKALSNAVVRVAPDSRPPKRESASSAEGVYAVLDDRDGSRLLGLVSQHEAFRLRTRIFADLLRERVSPVVQQDVPLDQVLLRMDEAGVDAVAVVDARSGFLGAVTRSSALRMLLQRERQLLCDSDMLCAENADQNRRLRESGERLRELNRASAKLLRLAAGMVLGEQTLREGINALTEVLQTRYGAVALRDADGKLESFVYVGVTEKEAERIGSEPTGRGLLGVVLGEQRSLRLEDMTSDPRSLGFPDDHPPMRSLLAVPIARAGLAFGQIYLSEKRSGEPFTEDDEVLAKAFAGMLALVIAHTEERAERRRAEAEEKSLQLQLVESQKLESIGRLAAGIAHEINTPAQYVGDNIEFLEQAFNDLEDVLKKYGELHATAEAGQVPPALLAELREAVSQADLEFLQGEIPRAIQQSREGIERVTSIVRAMKEFSHPGTEEKTPVDLNRAIESTVAVARNEWKYVADVELDLDADLPPVPCLPGELNQTVLNIVVNAAQAIGEFAGETPGEKGTISIRTRHEDECVEITIRDTGPGMPEDVRSKIFEPFFTTKEVGKGTGQGLAIARSVVVDKHGGTLECESEPRQGTTFRIRLPLDEPSETAAADPPR